MNTVSEIASAWGGQITRMVTERENRVYDMVLPDGAQAALRLHRVDYQSRAAIEDELVWTEAIASRGFPCPRPIATQSGEMVVETAEGLCSAVTWIDADPLADRVALGAHLAGAMRQLGGLLAQLHDLTDAANLSLNRHAWSRNGLTGSDPLWGRYWENPALDTREGESLIAARDQASAWLAEQPDLDIGLIHADAISENVLIRDDDMWLIDFDDSGTGYRLYDLGVPLVQFWQRDDFAELVVNMAEGYAAARDCEAAPLAQMIPKFTALRGMASAGWLIARAGPEDKRHRYYVDRALGLVSGYF